MPLKDNRQRYIAGPFLIHPLCHRIVSQWSKFNHYWDLNRSNRYGRFLTIPLTAMGRSSWLGSLPFFLMPSLQFYSVDQNMTMTFWFILKSSYPLPFLSSLWFILLPTKKSWESMSMRGSHFLGLPRCHILTILNINLSCDNFYQRQTGGLYQAISLNN